jgi:TolB protein
MSKIVARFSGTVILLAAIAGSVSSVPTVSSARGVSAGSSSPCNEGQPPGFKLASTIAFSSTRDDPTGIPVLASEIYLVNGDGTNPRRLTDNEAGDGLAALSPDGKKIVFDSTRNADVGEPRNTSDLFLMNADGSEQTFLTRGSSVTWSPDCKEIAFHASASGAGTPIKPDPGSATSDSDIFVANVDDVLASTEAPTNLTNSQGIIDDDPDWSPDGEKIVYTAHPATDDPRLSNQAEIHVRGVDGSGTPEQLTTNSEEERGPSWSPDGSLVVYACRTGGGASDFEICVMNADGSDMQQLTNNSVADLTPTFSPDGTQIVFNRQVEGRFQLFVMNADGANQTQLTNTPGLNLIANWGELRVRSSPESAAAG